MRTRTWCSAALLAATIAAASGAALGQGGPPPGAGPGGGYGPGMMGGGYGPGMMGGGYGGMMGGRGMMGGPGGYPALDLTDEQRQKLAALGEQSRRGAWDTMGQLRTEQYRLRELLGADPVNVGAVVDQQAKVDQLRRQLLKSRAESRNEMAAILTPDQRKKLRDTGPWWYRDDAVE